MTKSVIFIAIDALRQHRLSLYGYDRLTTPTLDRLAEQSLIRNNHFALNALATDAFPTITNASRPLSYRGLIVIHSTGYLNS